MIIQYMIIQGVRTPLIMMHCDCQPEWHTVTDRHTGGRYCPAGPAREPYPAGPGPDSDSDHDPRGRIRSVLPRRYVAARAAGTGITRRRSLSPMVTATLTSESRSPHAIMTPAVRVGPCHWCQTTVGPSDSAR